jgi:hypothetical protein
MDIIITDINPNDGWYDYKAELVGKKAEVLYQMHEHEDGWYGGLVTFFEPPIAGWGKSYTFFKVRYRTAE